MTEAPWHWFVIEVNPEPWAVGPLSVGRSKGGKVFPKIGRNEQMFHFQEAIKEELGDPGVFFEGKVELRVYFWRRRDEYKTPQSRTHRKHEADATNMLKATEDALQGVLFKNDKDNNDVRAVIVEQGADVTPRIVIAIRQGMQMPPVMAEFPQHVCELLDEIDGNSQPTLFDDPDKMEWTF